MSNLEYNYDLKKRLKTYPHHDHAPLIGVMNIQQVTVMQPCATLHRDNGQIKYQIVITTVITNKKQTYMIKTVHWMNNPLYYNNYRRL